VSGATHCDGSPDFRWFGELKEFDSDKTVDDQTSPTGALAAAQQLLQKDHVFAVIMESGVGFAAAPYLTSKGVPVLGGAVDGPEWNTARNMFSVLGPSDSTKVTTWTGQFFKQTGASNVGMLGYAGVPSSSESAQGNAISAQQAGRKTGYLNANIPLWQHQRGPDRPGHEIGWVGWLLQWPANQHEFRSRASFASARRQREGTGAGGGLWD
jgi:hypothetical protein